MILSLPDLGEIQLRACMEDSQVSVHLLVGNNKAKQWLEAQSGLLRTRWAAMGVAVVQFNIEGGDPGNSEHAEPEPCAHSVQTEIHGLPKLSNSLAQVTAVRGLVDIIA